MTSTSQVFSQAAVITERGSLSTVDLVVEDGLISHLGANYSTQAEYQRYLYPNHFIIPGMLDLHVHGAAGCDVMDAKLSSLQTISDALLQEGVTGFLATTMTAEVHTIERVLTVLAQFAAKQTAGAKLLGVHLEGPFLSTTYAGAQLACHCCAPDLALFARWQELSGGLIKKVTIAPELPGALAFIERVAAEGVIVSIGHSAADYATVQAAIAAGASQATHLFNAMQPLHQREPGCVGALLLADSIVAELIVDNEHLHPKMVELAVRVKGFSRLLLVSDAMRAKCLGNGCYDLGGQQVVVDNNRAALADGTLAGSVLTLNHALANLMVATGCTLVEAVALACVNPARALGLYPALGTLAVGSTADLVVLDANFQVVQALAQYTRD